MSVKRVAPLREHFSLGRVPIQIHNYFEISRFYHNFLASAEKLYTHTQIPSLSALRSPLHNRTKANILPIKRFKLNHYSDG
jgi:hypothetical protein